MPIIIAPLSEIVTDPDNPIDLTALPADEAIERIKSIYGFLSTAIDVQIDDGIATIKLPEEKGHQINQALSNLERAAKSARRGRYDAAIALYEACLDVLPTHTEARRELAMSLMEVGKNEEAKRHLIHVLQLDPKDAWAYLILGNLYLSAENDLGSAERYYTSAVDLAPDDPYIINALAGLKGQRGDMAAAEELFLRAIKLGPTVPNSRYGLALTYTRRNKLDEAISALEELFRQPVSEDPRHANVYSEARALYLETRRRRAIANYDKALEQLYAAFDAYREQSGYGIRVEQDPQLLSSAKVELAWVHGRQDHVIKYAAAESATEPYLLAHEFEHIILASEARVAGRNKHYAAGASERRTAERAIAKDVQRIQRRRRIETRLYQQFVDQIITGLTSQLYNAPLDFVIDYRIHTKYPYLHDSQYVWASDEQQKNLQVVTDKNLREMTPSKILQANVAMNAAGAVFFDELFDGVTSFAERYRTSGQLAAGQRLYNLWQKMLPTFTPGDEFDLVDAFAKELKLTDWYTWRPDDGAAAESPEPGEAAASVTPPGLADLLEDPAAQMAVTMYILSALERFAKLPQAEVTQIAGEIALLGQTGIDYTTSERKYTLRFLPGEQFSGLQLLALMFTGFKQIDPSLDTGMPFDAAYEQARRLYELRK